MVHKVGILMPVNTSKTLHDTAYSTNTFTKKQLKIELCAIRESFEIQSVVWVCRKDKLPDCQRKEGTSSEKLYDAL